MSIWWGAGVDYLVALEKRCGNFLSPWVRIPPPPPLCTNESGGYKAVGQEFGDILARPEVKKDKAVANIRELLLGIYPAVSKEFELMKETVFQTIIDKLSSAGITYALIEHEPVYTMEQAREACGNLPEQGVKTLFAKAYRSKKNFDYFILFGLEIGR